MHLESLDRKYLTISVTSSIKSTKIMVLRISEMVLVLDITYARFSNLAFLIGATIYMRFDLSRGYRYMHDGAESFSNIRIYSNIFGMTVAENISIETAKKTFLR